jgi:hypothetical protein
VFADAGAVARIAEWPNPVTTPEHTEYCFM